jgi:hypothetical protein
MKWLRQTPSLPTHQHMVMALWDTMEQRCNNCMWEEQVNVLRVFPCNPKARCQELPKTLHARWGHPTCHSVTMPRFRLGQRSKTFSVITPSKINNGSPTTPAPEPCRTRHPRSCAADQQCNHGLHWCTGTVLVAHDASCDIPFESDGS